MADGFQQMMEGAERLGSLQDADEVANNLGRVLEKMVRSSWTVVYFFDHERRLFTLARGYSVPASLEKFLLVPPLLPDKVPELKAILRKKQHLLIADAGESEILPEIYRKEFKSFSLLAVPMVVRNELTGTVITARKKTRRPFRENEISLITDMVSHAALVVSHMRLFDDTLDMALDLGKRIDIILTLDEINRAISSSLSRDKIIQTAMEHIERIIQCELVMVIEEDNQQIEVRAVHARGIPISPEVKKSPISESCIAEAFATGKTCLIASLKELKNPGKFDDALIMMGIESIMAIPLLSRNLVKGVLFLGTAVPDIFQEKETFTIEKIAAQMAVALENARLYEEMKSLFINTVASLANAIDAKSPWTKGHSQRVMHMAGKLAKLMQLPEEIVESVKIGGLLHDIGKIGIIEALLDKPAALSEDEFPPMRLHPEIGVSILEPIAQLRNVLPGILHHHEKYDGTGYPKHLKGEAIPLEARIIAVADAFDAMVADRPYKKGYSVKEAIAELRNCAGKHFDPNIVTIFTADIEKKWRLMSSARITAEGKEPAK